jgi:hypothetical protein
MTQSLHIQAQPSQAEVPAVVERYLRLWHARKEDRKEGGEVRVEIKYESGAAAVMELSTPFADGHSDLCEVDGAVDLESILDRFGDEMDRFERERVYGRLVVTVSYLAGVAVRATIDNPQLIRPQRKSP